MTFVRSCSSVVQVRAKERRAAFVALYVLYKGNPLGQLHEEVRMMEPPLFVGGSVF
jgi:hypothetical protein